MKRFPEIARRAAALALAASMSLSVLAPGAYAVSDTSGYVHLAAENSVDELGNEDLSDEVFDVPDDTAEKPVVVVSPREPQEQETEHQWGEWQELEDDDGRSVKYRVCSGCGTAELEDGTVILPEEVSTGDGLTVGDDDQPEWFLSDAVSTLGQGSQIATYGLATCSGPHNFDTRWNAEVVYWDYKSTCTKTGRAMVQCTNSWKTTWHGHVIASGRCSVSEFHTMDKKPHSYGGWITVPATCQAAGKKYCVCSVCGAQDVDTDYTKNNPQLEHDYGDWVYEPATCTEAAKKYRICQNEVNGKLCGAAEHDTEYEAANKATGHHTADGTVWYENDDATKDAGWSVKQEPTCGDKGVSHRVCVTCGKEETRDIAPTGNHILGEWKVIKEPACIENGIRVKYCTVCGEEVERDTTSDAVKALDHDWGEWVDDNQPACQQQTATRKCKREGCTGAEQKNLPNFGADDKPLAHRYTRWDTKIDGWSYVKYAKCDYCGAEYTEKIDGWGDITSGGTEQVAKLAADAVKADIKNAITQTLQTTAANVNAAQTKEEAITALLNFKDAAADALVENFKIKIKGDVVAQLSKKDALKIINDAIPDLDSIGKSLNDSFLSKDTIQAIVDKMANVVSSAEIQQAMEDAAYDLVYQAAYSYIDGGFDTKKIKVDDMLQVKNLVAKLVSATVASDYGWDKLTKAIVKDAVELGVGKLKEKEKYAKLLKTNLGVETLKEVEDAINQQLVNDPTFMKQVRDLLKNAANNASNGISRGWSDKRVLTDLRTDVMPVTELVANKISELGGVASDIADKKVNDTVKKYLPGKLGDWVSDKLGGYIKGQVQNEVDGVGEDVNDLITSYIKYLTCPRHHEATRTVQAQTCTTPKKTETYCTECDWVFKKEETAPALGHDPVTVPGVEPTETADGLTDGIQCARCGAWLEPQKVRPALNPEYDKWYVKADITAETVKAAGYQSKQKLDEAIDNALKKAGFEPADSERFLAQVQTNLDVLKDEYDREPGEGASRILTNDRYPEEGVTGMVKFPAKAPGKDGTYYAVQVVTADNHGYNAGDIVVTPLTVTKEGISLKTGVQAVVAIAWKPNN